MRADFRREQRRVAASMVTGILVTIVVFVVCLSAAHPSGAESFATRLQQTLRADLLVVPWLAAAIANVARLRFVSYEDIGGGGGKDARDPVRQAGAILQNTSEQTLLAVASHLIVTASLAHPAPLIDALAVTFAFGRFLFWFGYARGASGRALGFALTFYPSVAALLVASFHVVSAR